MRSAKDIKSLLLAAEDLPDSEREAKRDMLFLEVLLDIREKLDAIETFAIHTEGHAEALRKRLADDHG